MEKNTAIVLVNQSAVNYSEERRCNRSVLLRTYCTRDGGGRGKRERRGRGRRVRPCVGRCVRTQMQQGAIYRLWGTGCWKRGDRPAVLPSADTFRPRIRLPFRMRPVHRERDTAARSAASVLTAGNVRVEWTVRWSREEPRQSSYIW